MERVVRQLLEEVRRIALELRPQMLDDLGLPSALNELAAGFARRTGIPVERSFDQTAPAPDLPGRARVVPRRAGGAHERRPPRACRQRPAVAVGGTGQRDHAASSTTAAGSRPGDLEGNGGLRGMRERAVFVGGALAIEPGPGGGVEVRLEVPATERERAE